MLVLSRKVNESIVIGEDIKITVIQCEDGKVKIGIDAPKNIKVHREEVIKTIKEENKHATSINKESISKLKKL